MSGDLDIFPVPSAGILRASPSGRTRKTGKGYSPSKLPGCATSLISSSLRKGQSRYGRNSRRSMSETVLLAINGEKRGVVGGKIGTKRTVESTEGGILSETLDLRVRPRLAVGENKHLEECSLSAHCVDRHINYSPRQHSYSEKVTKWLEESQQLEDSEQSSVTELHDKNTLGNDEEEVSKQEQDVQDVVNDILQSLATCFLAEGETVADAADHEHRKQLAETLPEEPDALQAPVKILSHGKVEGSRVMELLKRYFKITMCLLIVFLGLSLQIRPASLQHNFDPPPT